MAWTVNTAFEEFHTIINLPGEHRAIANIRKDWLVSRIGSSLHVLDSFAMGSIPRYTALQGHADLDIMLVLHYAKHIENRLPSAVLLNLKSALGSAAGNIRRNGQAVTLKFLSWPDVDVVPAGRYTHSDGTITYSIPDMNREVWLTTNPSKHSSEIIAKSSLSGSKFRQVIKFMKEWNRRQGTSIQSYHLEVIALKTSTDWSDYSWSIYMWFKAAESNIRYCSHDGSNVSAYLTTVKADRVLEQISAMQSIALNAWYATNNGRNEHATAIRHWRTVFGQRFPGYGS